MKRIIFATFVCLVLADSMQGNTFASSDTFRVFPANGPETGGNAVAVMNYQFPEGVTVLFGDVTAATSEEFLPSALVCTPPAHEPGTVDVTITLPNSEPLICQDCYTFDPAPQISAISPDHGPASGGIQVSISGSHFLEGLSITFGRVPATDITIISATEIQCISPAHQAGTLDISVTNKDRQSATCQDCYQVDPPPAVTQMEPCPAYPDTRVTIRGENFSEQSEITFDGIPGTDIEFISSSEINCKTPAQAEGMPRELVIRNPDGQSDVYSCPALPAPIILSPVFPAYGPVTGGTETIITGSRFLEGIQVSFNRVPATDVRLLSDNTIQCVSPENTAGPADITVINPDNQTSDCPGCYTYQSGFTVSPAYGTTAGGTEILVTGENFSETTEILFDDMPAADITFISASEIKCKSPAHSAGITDITVKPAGGGSDVCTDCYTFLAPSDPLKIGNVTEAQELDCKTGSANLWVSGLISLNPIRRVWAIIVPPNTDPGVPVTYLPTVEFEDTDKDGIYEGRFEAFTTIGTAYKIGIYAEDEEKYLAVPPLQTSVIRICQKGDIDRDGDISLKDALIALKILTQTNVSLPDEPEYSAVDTDGDEKIGLAEPVYILDILGGVLK